MSPPLNIELKASTYFVRSLSTKIRVHPPQNLDSESVDSDSRRAARKKGRVTDMGKTLRSVNANIKYGKWKVGEDEGGMLANEDNNKHGGNFNTNDDSIADLSTESNKHDDSLSVATASATLDTVSCAQDAVANDDNSVYRPSDRSLEDLEAPHKKEERMLRKLPLGLQSWVLTALRKRAAELKMAFKVWSRNTGTGVKIDSGVITRILMKRQDIPGEVWGGYSEEDLEVLRDWCWENRFVDDGEGSDGGTSEDYGGGAEDSRQQRYKSVLTKISLLTSRVDILVALNSLHLQAFSPFQCILFQNHPQPNRKNAAAYHVLSGQVELRRLEERFIDSDSWSVFSEYLKFDKQPVLENSNLLSRMREESKTCIVVDQGGEFGGEEVEMVEPKGQEGGEDNASNNNGGGNISNDNHNSASNVFSHHNGHGHHNHTHNEHLSPVMAVTTCPTYCLTVPLSTLHLISQPQSLALSLAARTTFLKSTRLFPNLPHSELTNIASKMVLDSFAKHEILCRRGDECHHFYFVVGGEVLVQYFPPGESRGLREGEVLVRGGVGEVVMRRGGSVVGEDCMVGKGKKTFDVSAVVMSDKAVVYKVPRGIWRFFEVGRKVERAVAVLSKDRLRGDRCPRMMEGLRTLHTCGLETVRGIIGRNREARGGVPIWVYDREKEKEEADRSSGNTHSGTNTNTNTNNIHHSQNLSTSMPHARLGKETIKPLGECLRRAVLLAENEKRLLCKKRALARMEDFKGKIREESTAVEQNRQSRMPGKTGKLEITRSPARTSNIEDSKTMLAREGERREEERRLFLEGIEDKRVEMQLQTLVGDEIWGCVTDAHTNAKGRKGGGDGDSDGYSDGKAKEVVGAFLFGARERKDDGEDHQEDSNNNNLDDSHKGEHKNNNTRNRTSLLNPLSTSTNINAARFSGISIERRNSMKRVEGLMESCREFLKSGGENVSDGGSISSSTEGGGNNKEFNFGYFHSNTEIMSRAMARMRKTECLIREEENVASAVAATGKSGHIESSTGVTLKYRKTAGEVMAKDGDMGKEGMAEQKEGEEEGKGNEGLEEMARMGGSGEDNDNLELKKVSG